MICKCHCIKSKIETLLARATHLQQQRFSQKSVEKLVEFCTYNKNFISQSLKFLGRKIYKYEGRANYKFHNYIQIMIVYSMKINKYMQLQDAYVLQQIISRQCAKTPDQCINLFQALLQVRHHSLEFEILITDALIDILQALNFERSIQFFMQIQAQLIKQISDQQCQGIILFIVALYLVSQKFVMDQDDPKYELLYQQLKQLYNIYIYPSTWNSGKSVIFEKITQFDDISQEYLISCAYLNKDMYQKLIQQYIVHLKQKVQSTFPSAKLGDTIIDQLKKTQVEEKSTSTPHPCCYENIIVKALLSDTMMNLIFNGNEQFLKDIYELLQSQHKSYIKQYFCNYVIRYINESQQIYPLYDLIDAVFQSDLSLVDNQQYYMEIIDSLFKRPYALSIIQLSLEFLYVSRSNLQNNILIQAIAQYTYGALKRIKIQNQTKLLSLITNFLNYQTSYHQIFLDLIKNNMKTVSNTYNKLYYCIIYLIIHKCIPTNQDNYVIFLILVSDIFDVTFEEDFKKQILGLWAKQTEYDIEKNTNEILLLLQNFDNPLFIQNQLNQLNIEQISDIENLYNCKKVINIASIYLSNMNENAIDRPTIRQNFYELVKSAYQK